MSMKVLLVWLSMGIIRAITWFNLDLGVHNCTSLCPAVLYNSCTVPHLVYIVVIGIIVRLRRWHDNLICCVYVYSSLDIVIIRLFKLFQTILIADG